MMTHDEQNPSAAEELAFTTIVGAAAALQVTMHSLASKLPAELRMTSSRPAVCLVTECARRRAETDDNVSWLTHRVAIDCTCRAEVPREQTFHAASDAVT